MIDECCGRITDRLSTECYFTIAVRRFVRSISSCLFLFGPVFILIISDSKMVGRNSAQQGDNGWSDWGGYMAVRSRFLLERFLLDAYLVLLI